MPRLLAVVATAMMLLIVSCAVKEQQMEQADGSATFITKPLEDDWSRWLVGHWQGKGQSNAGDGVSDMTIELGLNGQFLIFTSEDRITELTDEQAAYLKRTTGASDEDIERFRKSGFKEVQFQTVDPQTGEVVGYLFDSLRCIAIGRGKIEGNKQIMEWKWSVGGRGTSTSIIEKINENTFTISGVYKLDGKTVEDKAAMTMTRIAK